MSVPPDKTEFRFEVAFSFAGPHRDQVRAIAERLSEAIDPGLEDRGKGHVFFDEWFQHEILGSDMDVLLQRFYHEQSLMVVADLSEAYADRPWTQAEARAIRALRMKLDPARDETARLRPLNVRFGPGEVPGVFNTEGWLDGINLSAEEIADVILKRRELLRERLGTNREGEAPAEPQATSGVPPSTGSAGASPSRVPPSLVQRAPKGWVWHSILATRAAGQVSVLAVVETLLAIVLYWWIALRFETHWHLVSSVFIAPLLLLRSPESMDSGVRWFLTDWFGVNQFEYWPDGKQTRFWVLLSLIFGCVSFWMANELVHLWLTGLRGWSLFWWAAGIGAIAIVASTAVKIATVVDDEDSVEVKVAIAGVFARMVARMFATAFVGALVVLILFVVCFSVSVAGAFAIAGAGFVTGAIASAYVFGGAGASAATILSPAVGVGIVLRGLVFRVLATVCHLPAGVRQISTNWRESNFVNDCCLAAELMPGIRDHNPVYSLDGLLTRILERIDVTSCICGWMAKRSCSPP